MKQDVRSSIQNPNYTRNDAQTELLQKLSRGDFRFARSNSKSEIDYVCIRNENDEIENWPIHYDDKDNKIVVKDQKYNDITELNSALNRNKEEIQARVTEKKSVNPQASEAIGVPLGANANAAKAVQAPAAAPSPRKTDTQLRQELRESPIYYGRRDFLRTVAIFAQKADPGEILLTPAPDGDIKNIHLHIKTKDNKVKTVLINIPNLGDKPCYECSLTGGNPQPDLDNFLKAVWTNMGFDPNIESQKIKDEFARQKEANVRPKAQTAPSPATAGTTAPTPEAKAAPQERKASDAKTPEAQTPPLGSPQPSNAGNAAAAAPGTGAAVTPAASGTGQAQAASAKIATQEEKRPVTPADTARNAPLSDVEVQERKLEDFKYNKAAINSAFKGDKNFSSTFENLTSVFAKKNINTKELESIDINDLKKKIASSEKTSRGQRLDSH